MLHLFLKTKKPEIFLFWGYLAYTVIGVLLLSLPAFRKINVSVIDSFFISVSAISTTGLVTISVVDSYKILGQIVVIILIQIGGMGYMTFGSFIILFSRKALSPEREVIHQTAFSLPKDFSIKKFIKSLVIYTIIVEILGALFLMPLLWNDGRVNPVWSSIFHSISAFCTAGFSLYNDSFEQYSGSKPINIIIFVLSFLGAIGYIVMVDIWLLVRGKKKQITFTSKIILTITIVLLFFGTLFLFLENCIPQKTIEWNFLLKAFFQAMTALTTVGFNTISIGELKSSSLFILTILMIIGASPSGTGGGIKSTTVSSMFGVISSVFSFQKEYINYQQDLSADKKGKSLIQKYFKKKKEINLNNNVLEKNIALNSIFGEVFQIKLLKRTIPYDRIIQATAIFVFYFSILFFGIFLLLTAEAFTYEQIFFEAASALGTVGLSTGITGSLSFLGKAIIIILMFIGRIGPITFGIVLFRREEKKIDMEYEDIVI